MGVLVFEFVLGSLRVSFFWAFVAPDPGSWFIFVDSCDWLLELSWLANALKITVLLLPC